MSTRALTVALTSLFLALPAAAQSSTTPASTLDRVLASKTLRVCTTGDYNPFSVLDPKTGTFSGVDIDLAQSLARSLDAQAVFVPSTWKNLVTDLTAGKCDVVMGGVSITLPRQRAAAFSVPALVSGKAAIARCEDKAKYTSLSQIDQPGVRVIVNVGGTNETFARSVIRRATILTQPTNVGIFDQISQGNADVMMTDAVETLVHQKLDPRLCAINPDKPFTFAELGYMMPRGDVAWKAYVDQWLHLAQGTGEYKKVFDSWVK